MDGVVYKTTNSQPKVMLSCRITLLRKDPTINEVPFVRDMFQNLKASLHKTTMPEDVKQRVNCYARHHWKDS